MKHTKGPWSIQASGLYDISYKVTYYDTKEGFTCPIANIHILREDLYYKKALANARLIAAAPDLLEAAKALTSGMYAGHVPERKYKQVVALRKAISKATGGGE